MRHSLALLGVLIALSGCATVAGDDGDSVSEVFLGHTARLGPLAVTPMTIVEDSRCPTGVQCIQAGTVRLQARIIDLGPDRSTILDLGVPQPLNGGWVSLARVCPYPVHGGTRPPRDYRFLLVLSRSENPSIVDVPGCSGGRPRR